MAWERRVSHACDDEHWWRAQDGAWAIVCEEWRLEESVRAAVRESMRAERERLRGDLAKEEGDRGGSKHVEFLKKMEEARARVRCEADKQRAALRAWRSKERAGEPRVGTCFGGVCVPADSERSSERLHEGRKMRKALGIGTCGGTQEWRARLRERRWRAQARKQETIASAGGVLERSKCKRQHEAA